MSKAKSKAARGFPLPDEVLRRRRELGRSGAAGVHSDQNARRQAAVGFANRVGSRSSQRAVAVEDQYR